MAGQLTYKHLKAFKSYGRFARLRKINHRKPFMYHKFQDNVDPEAIVEHYSREDIDQLDPRAGERTYKDARLSMARKNLVLPTLRPSDLELNAVFDEELKRQRAMIARVDKIRVIVESVQGRGTEMMMNKNLSTPHDCASHLDEYVVSRSIVAEVSALDQPRSTDSISDNQTTNQDNKEVEESRQTTYWDMHRPLEKDCRVKFRHFLEDNQKEVNKIYWRSCSFVLGMAVRLAFKDEIRVLLHSWPKPDVNSGSFVYDVALSLDKQWQPTEQELRAFTKIMWQIKASELPFERLMVNKDVAKRMFANNPFKLSQIDAMLPEDSGKISVYRCGGLLDMSVGPMIGNTNQIGRITLAAVHPFDSNTEAYKGLFYRFQGVSLPQQLPLSSYMYQNILINRAQKLNKASL